MGFAQRLLRLTQLGFILLADVLGASPEPVLHIALLVDPTFHLGDGEVVLASHFRSGGFAFENIHDHGGLTLHGPAFDGRFVAYLFLLIAAL